MLCWELAHPPHFRSVFPIRNNNVTYYRHNIGKGLQYFGFGKKESTTSAEAFVVEHITPAVVREITRQAESFEFASLIQE